MIPLFPLPLFKQLMPPLLWSLSPVIIALATLVYFSTVLPCLCHSKWGDRYYRYCSFFRPASLLLIWLGWSFSLSCPCESCRIPLFTHQTLFYTIAGWTLAFVSFLLFIISVNALGVRQSFLCHMSDDPVVRSSIYNYVHHPQYCSSAGMISGVVIAENSLSGAVLILLFCLLLVAGAHLEERDLSGEAKRFSPWSVFIGAIGFGGMLYVGFLQYEAVAPLVSSERLGLAGDELLQAITVPVLVVAAFSSLAAVIVSIICRDGKRAAFFLNIFVMLSILHFFVFIMWGGFRDAVNQGNFTCCKRNEEMIAKALGNYASLHNGKYPGTLENLIPDGIPSVPVCSAAKRNTYSAGYKVSDDRKSFTIRCKGRNHCFWREFKKVCLEDDYPIYD